MKTSSVLAFVSDTDKTLAADTLAALPRDVVVTEQKVPFSGVIANMRDE